MKNIDYYKNNFGNLSLEELTEYYWMLIDECARKLVDHEDFRELHTSLMATSTAITVKNFSDAVNKIEENRPTPSSR